MIYIVTRVLLFYTFYSINSKLVWDVKGNNPKGKVLAACKHAKQIIAIRELLWEYLWIAAKMQVKYYNKFHIVKIYNARDIVLLLTKNIKLAHLSKKLDYHFAELF